MAFSFTLNRMCGALRLLIKVEWLVSPFSVEIELYIISGNCQIWVSVL